jgi:hypothetical protein
MLDRELLSLRFEDGRRIRVFFVPVSVVGLLLLASPVFALTDATHLSGATNRSDAGGLVPCSLLPELYPILVNGTANETFTIPAPPSGAGASTNSTATVGEVRSIWNRVCQTQLFVEAAQNLTYSFGAGISEDTRVQNFSIDPGFSWAANCTLNETNLLGEQPIPASPPPPYTGTGCSYLEYWSGNVTANGTTIISGPFLFESIPEHFGGPSTGPRTLGFGSVWEYPGTELATLAVLGIIIAIVVVTRGSRVRTKPESSEYWPGGGRPEDAEAHWSTEAAPGTRSQDPPDRQGGGRGGEGISSEVGSDQPEPSNDSLNDLL